MEKVRTDAYLLAENKWWAWVDLNHRPRPYQGLLWCYMHSNYRVWVVHSALDRMLGHVLPIKFADVVERTWIRREFDCFRSKWPKIRHLCPKYLQQSLDFSQM